MDTSGGGVSREGVLCTTTVIPAPRIWRKVGSLELDMG